MNGSKKRKRWRRAVSRSMARLTASQTEPMKTPEIIDPPEMNERAKQGGILRDEITLLDLPVRLSNIEDNSMTVDPTKIVLLIVIFALLFIGFITWLIATTPPKP